MISIIIPIYNQADKLGLCLESILAQTEQDFEIIIVNDGSIDKPSQAVEHYRALASQKIIFINQENQGANAARNNGRKKAQGDYLLFCDADIILEPEMLSIMKEALEQNQKASYAYSSFRWGLKTFQLWEFDAEKLKQMPYIHTTSLIRAKDFPQKGFDLKIKKLQDWDLWLTMLKERHIGIWIDKILFKVQTGGTMSNWLPSFVYKLMPFLPEVKKYKQAVEIIKQKHGAKK